MYHLQDSNLNSGIAVHLFEPSLQKAQHFPAPPIQRSHQQSLIIYGSYFHNEMTRLLKDCILSLEPLELQ